MESVIRVEGREYALVKEQRSGLSVFRGTDTYLRIGEPDAVERNINNHQAMSAQGFPVAAVLGRGTIESHDYFIEQSLGDKTFRTLFEEDIIARGMITDTLYAEFVGISKRYLEAQVRTMVPADPEGFARGVHLDILRTELPQYTVSLRDKFERVLRKLAGFPYVLSHGDFNAANMYPLGVIDLEDAFSAPFGFDAVCAISTIEWFPQSEGFEYFAHYGFSEAQKRVYLDMCDAVSVQAGYSPISAYYEDFAFYRAIWSTARMQAWPRLQAWRYDKFIRTYLFS